MKALGKVHCGPSESLHSWHPGQRSMLPAQGWAGCFSLRLICRDTHKKTEAHKTVFLGDLQADYKLLGTIKAFSDFWLQILVTQRYIQTSFFSPFEQFCIFFLLSFKKQTPIALLGNSKDKWGWSRWYRKEIRPWTSTITLQGNLCIQG